MVPEITPAEAKAWREREKQRMTDGTYTILPESWRHAYWFTNPTARRVRDLNSRQLEHAPKYPDHFAHISVDRVSMIAFTENDQKGVRDRQTRINPGKYLAKYFGDVLSKTDIQYLATEMGAQYNDDADLLFATTADEFEEIYTTGPSSCMSHDESHFSSHVHPVRVYAGFDLQLAYLKRQDRITARALCWPEKKIYGRVYGDSARLGAALGKAGYEQGSLSGARITKLMQGGAYVIPFLDYLEGAVDCGEHLQVFERRPDNKKFCCSGGQQNGLSEDDDTQSCEACGNGGNEDDMYWVDGDEAWYCSHCYSRSFTRCDQTGETVRREEVEEVRRSKRADGRWRTAQWGEYARETDAFYCEVDSVYYDANQNEQHKVDGIPWGPDAWERYGIVIDGVDTDKRTLPEGELPAVQPLPQAPAGEIVVGCMVMCSNVNCIDNTYGFKYGDLYKVTRVYAEGVNTRVMVERDSVGSTTNGWGIENFLFHSMPERYSIRDDEGLFALYDGDRPINWYAIRANAEVAMQAVQAGLGLHIRHEPERMFPYRLYDNNGHSINAWSTLAQAEAGMARLQQRQPEEVAI